LNISIKNQTLAFLKGFECCFPRSYLSLFSSVFLIFLCKKSELNRIISGENNYLDIENLKKYTKYYNCSGLDKNIENFWKCIEEFTPENRINFLRFCTSCSRAPIGGFSELNPYFTIELIYINNDNEKLPTAYTCFNLLRLPTYSSYEKMKEKLEYVINSGLGFELT